MNSRHIPTVPEISADMKRLYEADALLRKREDKITEVEAENERTWESLKQMAGHVDRYREALGAIEEAIRVPGDPAPVLLAVRQIAAQALEGK